MKEIPTRYNPKEIEEAIYTLWEKNKFFSADEKNSKESYSIVIPPPNITGILHMGHALNNTLQDILIRWKRMQGFETLWMPGTDHAGIATQNVVERELSKQGLKRDDLGREEFLKKVWQWKDEYGSTIIKQLKRLGASCDWDRERFTMDEGLSNAVREVFKRLYKDDLVYKGDYIINWCPRCRTALSDEEAEHREVEGMLYYIKYPVSGRKKLKKENEDYVVIATTRPETMLADVAVAVNPKDARYSLLAGKTVVLPIINRQLKIIFDKDVDPAFGTGALKVTPAHDPVDFELGKKHGLEPINVMHSDGRINSMGADYEGMDRFECRQTIIEDLKQRKLFVRSEKHMHAVGHCYRCHTVVEPRLSKQWFVKMAPLAQPAIKAVKDKKIKFYPLRWTKVYLNWMENIRPWCISRQIWWGHRIPVWYCKDCLKFENAREVEVSSKQKGIYVGDEKNMKCPVCGKRNMEQDPDVLDTWFSSWLWPFSTLGWPEETKALKKFYPTDVLVTAPEIIFFWVARMIMAGIKFQKQIPFKDVYIHGTVRDASGTKMSKSLGNVIDPLDVIKEVGSDALRFSIISVTSQGQDVFLSKEKFDFGRNFANKLWNASRYVLMNANEAVINGEIDPKELQFPEKWILSCLNDAIREVTKALEKFRFNDASSVLYDFIWHKYCDWYLEFSKLSENKETAGKVLIKVLKNILKLLHPIMPFITEEIWHKMPPDAKEKNEWLMTSAWPESNKKFENKIAVDQMERMIKIITAIRNVRAFWNINHTVILEVCFAAKSDSCKQFILENSRYIEEFAKAKVKIAETGEARAAQSVECLAGLVKMYVLLGKEIDLSREKSRIDKKIKELERYVSGIRSKLANKRFLDKAPRDVIQKEKNKQEKFEHELKTLKDNLKALK